MPATLFSARDHPASSTMTAYRFAQILAGLAISSALVNAEEPAASSDRSTKTVIYSTWVDVDSGGAGFIRVSSPSNKPEIWPSIGPDSRRDTGPFFLAAHSSTTDRAGFIAPWIGRVRILENALTTFADRAEAFDPANAKDLRQFDVAANPQGLAFTPDGRSLAVACDPPGRLDRPICFVDLKSGTVDQRTIPGSSNLRGIAVDPEGRYLLATHLVPKSDLPATQIAQGWVFTNSISVVPLDGKSPIVTLPLDLRTQGFANPEGIAIAPDGKRAYVTHAGADVVSVLDLPAFHAVTSQVVMTSEPLRRDAQPAYRSEDLSLTRKYVRARIPVGSNPRGVAVYFDNKSVVVFNRLDHSVSIIDAEKLAVTSTLPVDTQRQRRSGSDDEETARMGERLFYSGKLSFSGQFSCASCHPDGHTDGLNWDLPADGFNNFHNTKSLLGAAGTAPYGWNGTSDTLKSRFVGTLKTLFQYEPSREDVTALESYLEQLDYPARLPHRTDPKSPAAERGRAVFQGVARCRDCHSGPRFTDGALHDVGMASGNSSGEAPHEIDTPSLIRISETAPYLHDGRAETLEAIFRDHNPEKRHGNAAALDAAQLADLIEYLKSL